MPLREDFIRAGNYLFQWRSYLPLFMAFLFLLALFEYRHPLAARRPGTGWQLFCLGFSLVGEMIRFCTVGFVPRGTSGRNTRGQVADTLNTRGMYSLVRNPLYLGNLVIWLGLSLVLGLWWLSLLMLLAFLLFYERVIFAEESFLEEKFGDTFVKWASETPALLPRWRHWRPPELSFSFKSAIAREYSSFFAIIASFTCLEFMANLVAEGRFALSRTWLLIFTAGLIIYLTIRTLKKKTRILRTADR